MVLNALTMQSDKWTHVSKLFQECSEGLAGRQGGAKACCVCGHNVALLLGSANC